MACNVHLVQMLRQRDGAQAMNCVLDDSSWELIAKTICDGARVDRISVKLNREFLKMLSSKKMVDNRKMLTGLMVTDTDTYAAASKEMALDMISEKGLPFHIPLTFLHHDSSQTEHFTQFDIHEGILFQVLHGWDMMETEQRVQFVMLGLEKFSKVPHDTDFYTIARLDKIAFFGMLMAARGKCVKALIEISKQGGLSPCSHTGMDEVDITKCDYCYKEYYINKLYAHFNDAILDMDVADQMDVEQLARLLNPAYFQSIAIQVMYFIWNGIATFPQNLMADFDPAKTRVYFLLDTKKSPAILLREGNIAECNHDALLARISRRFFFHMDYGCGECGSYGRDGILHVKVKMDDRNFMVLPPDDAVMNERLDSFNKLVVIIGKEPELMTKLNKLINKHFSECPKFDQLSERVRWVCYEMVYNRFINVQPELHDKKKHGEIPVDEKRRCALQMTFCIRTIPDKKWKKNDDRAIAFLADAHVLHTTVQHGVLARMCLEEDIKKQRESKKATKSTAACQPQLKKEVESEQPPPPPVPIQLAPLPLPPPPQVAEAELEIVIMPRIATTWTHFSISAVSAEEGEQDEEESLQESLKQSPQMNICSPVMTADRWLDIQMIIEGEYLINMLDD